jgi:putative spermidine/putrescine transport system substrate-binding protein
MRAKGEARSGLSRKSGAALAVLVLALAVVVAGCGDDDEDDGGSSGEITETTASGLPKLDGVTIDYIGFGGTTDEAMQKVWFKPFEEATGAKVVLDSPTDYNKIEVQQQSDNVTYDLVDGDAFVMDPGCGSEWAEINVPNAAKALEQYRPQSNCTVPDYVYTYVIAYDPDQVQGEPPNDCADFFDTDNFPGGRQVWSYYYGGPPECAAIAGGADEKNPYPLDIDAVGSEMESIKGDLQIFDTSQQAVDAMTNDDVAMGIYTTRMVLAANEAGANWEIATGWSSTATGTFGIPDGAPDAEAAEALLNYIMDPKNNIKFAEELPAYGSVVSEKPPASASRLETPLLASGSPELLEQGLLIDWDWWAQNDQEFSQVWTSATTG